MEMGVIQLPHAPVEFRLEATDSPVTGSELRRGGPHRGLDYYDAEARPVFSVSVDTRLFERLMTGMRSEDGAIYSQNENTMWISPVGRFLAYGLAIRDQFNGVAVYSGNCKRL